MTEVSVILTACNQGKWVRETVDSAAESLQGYDHEIIVVDDHSVDHSCHDLPREVLIVRPEWRLGVSGARRLGAERSQGNVLIFSDPHCVFPGDALKMLADTARRNWAVVQPPTNREVRSKRLAWGGRFVKNERGLALGKAREGEINVALINTIYAVRRDVYEHFGGWPHLPGAWGYSEQAMSCLLWFSCTPILVCNCPPCTHLNTHVDGRLTFKVTTTERAANGHYVHKLFFPQTYEDTWKPILIQKFGSRNAHPRIFDTPEYENLIHHIIPRIKRTEVDFYNSVFRSPLGFKTEQVDDAYVQQQRQRSDEMGFAVSESRLDGYLQFLIDNKSGCISGKSLLDLGTRDGRLLKLAKLRNSHHCEGVELLPEVVSIGQAAGRAVRQGDIRKLADANDSWDIVCCHHALEHLPDPDECMKEIARVLKPGGWFSIAVPKEAEPNPQWGHNSCWPDRKALKRYCEQQLPVIGQTLRGRAFRPSNGEWEIQVIGQKKR